MPKQPASRWEQICAAGVHIYTATGVIWGFLMIVAAFQDNASLALWANLVAQVVDGTDGALARRFRVKEILPSVDGRRLDDIVDYLTYVFAPIVLLWGLNYLPAGIAGIIVAAIPLLASSYQFSQVEAKTEDHSFLGFPSYWNVVAFYVVVLNLSPTITALVLIFWAIMVFVPIHYLYPSRTTNLRTLTLTLTVLWMVSYGLILTQMPNPNQPLVFVSLLYMAYYFFLSVYNTVAKDQRRQVPAD
jgi:phosphatidylcholine synthase